MFRIVCTTLLFVIFLGGNDLRAIEPKDLLPYKTYREKMQKGNYYTYEGTCTKIYDGTIVRNFEIYCGKWIETKDFNNETDSLRKCRWISKDNRLYADSMAYKNGSYVLFERVYNIEGYLIYFISVEGKRYSIERYESGRLVSIETWCDTARHSGNRLCLSVIDERENSIKPDSLGLFLTSQIRYVWDEKGRLKQRILWELGNPYGLNGTYEFIYKSPCDPVKVVPEDREWGWDAMQKGRYDGSFGKIPELGDPGYEAFVENPYAFPSSGIGPHDRTPEEILKDIRERQKKRCEDYKKSLKKKDSKK